MEPLSAAVTAIVTGYFAKGAAKLAEEVGGAAAAAARTLAEAVLDRLKADPAEERNAERYRQDPEAIEPTIQKALDDQIAVDAEFATRLQGLVDTYRASATTSVQTGNVGRDVIVGSGNTTIDGNTGTVNINNDA